jgi:hypothetical protein
LSRKSQIDAGRGFFGIGMPVKRKYRRMGAMHILEREPHESLDVGRRLLNLRLVKYLRRAPDYEQGLIGRTPLNCDQKSRRVFAAFGLAWLLSGAAPAFAVDSGKPAMEKWRPKDGLYAGPTNFNDKCRDSPDLFLELADKSLSAAGEEMCKIVKLADTASGTITLDVSCTDVGRERPYKKIILLKKIDKTTIFWRATAEAKLKFTYPGVRVSYCPEEDQRAYMESKKKSD